VSKMIPGQPETVGPGVQRIVAPNGGMMTGPGTNTYVLGDLLKAVVDPGPVSEEHLEALLSVVADRLRWILVTHTHRDHSPGARALADATGAELIGLPPPDAPLQDGSFSPQRQPAHDELLQLGDLNIVAIHTPGHASNHVCYLDKRSGLLFSGDHINQGSTVVIIPPDGCMSRYLGTLHLLKGYEIGAIAPGHGSILDKPFDAIDRLIRHRMAREARVRKAVEKYPGLTLDEMTARVYSDVSSTLHELAKQSLYAHLLKLQQDGEVIQSEDKGWVLNA